MDIDLLTPTPSSPPRRLRPQKELLIAWTLLLLDDGQTYGYTLHHGLRAHGIDLQASSLYRWLAKFERDAWVASDWSEPVDGPRRHVYRLTAEGRTALAEMTALIAAMRDSYSMFLEAHARAVERRGDVGADVDEEAMPVTREPVAASPEGQAGSSQAPSAKPPLRPHKELLVGWLLLHRDAGATYGYDLRRDFDAQRLSPDPPAMYRTLRRLEADKWVQSRWMRSAAGPRRRFYRLTGRGRRNLDEIAKLIAAIHDAHEDYLQAYELADHLADRPIDQDRAPI